MNLIGKDHRFFLQQLYYYYSFLHEMSERRACEEILSRRVSFISCAMFCRCLSLSLCLPLCVSVFMRCVTLRVLIANRMVTDSSCRGGIVNIRDVCSCALSKAPQSSKALWRFRVSTSNSPSGQTRLQVFEALELTVFGSICTRKLIDRTLICNAILYHFQITLRCGRTNRP